MPLGFMDKSSLLVLESLSFRAADHLSRRVGITITFLNIRLDGTSSLGVKPRSPGCSLAMAYVGTSLSHENFSPWDSLYPMKRANLRDITRSVTFKISN